MDLEELFNNTEQTPEGDIPNYKFSVALVKWEGQGLLVSILLPGVDKAICLDEDQATKLAYTILQAADALRNVKEGIQV